MPDRFHAHEWTVVEATELGDTFASCPCGAERLLTGTIARYRRNATDPWETPYAWNKEYYGRKRGQEEAL
jgi:hypothetical protein